MASRTFKHDDDGFLLLQMEKGNEEAFNKLFDKYWEQAYNSAYKRLNNSAQAKDIVQDIFLNIWERRQNHINNLPAYLYVAVRNRVFKHIRKERKTVPFLDKLENIHTTHRRSEENDLWNQLYNAYEALIPTLPPKRQKIFRLRYKKNLTTKAIAKKLGISRKTVQNQLGKAVIQLRTALQIFTIIIYLNLVSFAFN